jgi:His-Xaa-Ser system protein HxsD
MPNPSYEVRFSSHAYSLETIKRAAYRFTGQLAFNFLPEKDYIVCQITPISATDTADIEIAINEFKNEVLDQDLRRSIADETATVRNVILAHVFSKTGLQSVE